MYSAFGVDHGGISKSRKAVLTEAKYANKKVSSPDMDLIGPAPRVWGASNKKTAGRGQPDELADRTQSMDMRPAQGMNYRRYQGKSYGPGVDTLYFPRGKG